MKHINHATCSLLPRVFGNQSCSMKTLRELVQLLLLAASTAVWLSPSQALLMAPWNWSTHICRGEARWLCLQQELVVRRAGTEFLPPGVMKQCMAPLRPVSGCAPSVFRSISSGKVLLSRQCCRAVRGMSEDCFNRLFNTAHFGEPLAPKVKAQCSVPPQPAPVQTSDISSKP